MKFYDNQKISQAVIKVTESTIIDDNFGRGSGGYEKGELVVVSLIKSYIPFETFNLTVGSEYEWEDSHRTEGVYGYVESLNKGIVVFVD